MKSCEFFGCLQIKETEEDNKNFEIYLNGSKKKGFTLVSKAFSRKCKEALHTKQLESYWKVIITP